MLPYFVGTCYDIKLDSKGRLSIPAKWRERLGTEFYMVSMTIKGSKCVTLYPADEFCRVVERMESAVDTENEMYEVSKTFFDRAEEGVLDAQGRFTINQRIKDMTGLENSTSVILQGQRKTIEIWKNDEISKLKESIDTSKSVFDLMDAARKKETAVKADGE